MRLFVIREKVGFNGYTGEKFALVRNANDADDALKKYVGRMPDVLEIGRSQYGPPIYCSFEEFAAKCRVTEIEFPEGDVFLF